MTSAYRAALAALALSSGALLAQGPGEVNDQAKLFKPETIQKANEAISDLAKRGIHLTIETYPSVSKEKLDKIKEPSANTIFILLTTAPKHLEVGIGPDVQKRGFTHKDRAALTEAMLEKLRKGAVDEALLDALASLRKHFEPPPGVRDEAGLFKAETVQKANEAIADLAKRGIRLAVETYPGVPKDAAEKFKAMDAKARDEFFGQWGKRRVEELGPSTIYILLTDQPKHLQISVGTEAQKRGFTPQDRAALVQQMLDELRTRHIDAALLGAIATLRKQFDPPPAGSE
jgi:hypothetical protein